MSSDSQSTFKTSKEQNPLIARLRDPKLIGHEGLREEAALEIELLQDRESRLRATDLREALRRVCEHSARGSVAYQIAAGALADSPAETPAERGCIPPDNPQLQAHIRAVAAFMEELGPYLGLEDGLVTTGEFIEATKRIRQWCSDHQRPLDFVRALKIAEGVFEQYGKDQPKWWKRMDGTPILNDVAVRMAEAFRAEAQSPVKTSGDSHG